MKPKQLAMFDGKAVSYDRNGNRIWSPEQITSKEQLSKRWRNLFDKMLRERASPLVPRAETEKYVLGLVVHEMKQDRAKRQKRAERKAAQECKIGLFAGMGEVTNKTGVADA